jgi:hypothetical protein
MREKFSSLKGLHARSGLRSSRPCSPKDAENLPAASFNEEMEWAIWGHGAL